MHRRILVALAATMLSVASSSPAAAQWHALTFVRDTSFNLRSKGFTGNGLVLARRDGGMVLAPEHFRGELAAFDSAFQKLPWSVQLGRGPGGEVFYVTQWGWVGDSLWLLDPFYKQIAIVGSKGNVTKSIGWPSWVRPFWKDRRTYPLFANMTWHGAYPDASLLVEPAQPRHLLDTPGYDPDQKLLVRIDGDGRILKTVARKPAMDGRFQLRSGTEKQWVAVPNYAKTVWAVSTDARRVAVVSPIATDSGAFRIVVTDANGDTAFTRRYAVEAARIAPSRIDSIAARQQKFGRYTAAQVGDTVRKLTPAFYSPVISADVGLDYSVWVSVRRPSTRIEDAEYFVVDSLGEPQGVVTMLRQTRIVARSLDKYWVSQLDRGKQTNLLIRFVRAGATGARPSRSAQGAARSPSTKAPE